jgi:hypothetical protein
MFDRRGHPDAGKTAGRPCRLAGGRWIDWGSGRLRGAGSSPSSPLGLCKELVDPSGAFFGTSPPDCRLFCLLGGSGLGADPQRPLVA